MSAAMVAEIAIPVKAQGHLRRLDMRRDLAKVADLVELCFFNTLDPEGKQYLKDMRRAAQNASWMVWTSRVVEEAPMPPSGYIWEEDGQLVGNLSLIPISLHGKRGYMIANVATHPDYRGRGIARALTTAALDYAHARNAAGVWLQVRDDNPTAIHIYETSGFVERLRRTSWYSGPNPGEYPIPPGIKVVKRRREHWELQHQWLKRSYPPEMEWNVPMDWNIFRVDFLGQIYRLFNLDYPLHWSVERDGALEGVFTWKYVHGYTSPVWLAIPQEPDCEAVLALLHKVRKHIRVDMPGERSGRVGQPLSLNFPSGVAGDILRNAGFYAHQTLIWMEYQALRTPLTKL